MQIYFHVSYNTLAFCGLSFHPISHHYCYCCSLLASLLANDGLVPKVNINFPKGSHIPTSCVFVWLYFYYQIVSHFVKDIGMNNIWMAKYCDASLMWRKGKCHEATNHHPDPFYLDGLTLIPAWINNYSHCTAWGEIIHSFLNINGAVMTV